MKKITAIFLAIGLLCAALNVPAMSEGSEFKEALKRKGIDSNPIGISISGNFAACGTDYLGKKTLCVFEKNNDAWELAICNPKALKQSLSFPKIDFNNEYFLTWEYNIDGNKFIFSSMRLEDKWGPVSQYAQFNDNKVYKEFHSLSWEDNNCGKIAYKRSIAYSDLTPIAEDEEPFYLPAYWLADERFLADFDVERFPAIGINDFTIRLIAGQYIKESAEKLVPNSECFGGFFKDGDMHYFIQMKNGEKYYAIVDCSNKNTVSVIKSALLPQDTQFGVENLATSLGIGGLAVSVNSCGQNFCLDYIDTCKNYENNTVIYPRGVLQGGFIDLIYYGNHPWSDVSRIDWSSLPKSWREAAKQIDSSGYAMVNNPDPKDRLHLRMEPDKNSRSKGKYYNGTPVTVLETKGAWTHVEIGDAKGWMMSKYLYFPTKGETLLCDMTASGNLAMSRQAIRVYDKPRLSNDFLTPYTMHTFDPEMKVIGIIGNDWYHVWFPRDDVYGYVLQNSVSPGNG